MNQLGKPFLQIISLLLGLLALATALVAMVGGVVLISSAGIQLPSLKNSNPETSLQTEVAEVKPKYLEDPAGMWMAPDWSKVELEPNAEEIKYGRDLIANTAQ